MVEYWKIGMLCVSVLRLLARYSMIPSFHGVLVTWDLELSQRNVCSLVGTRVGCFDHRLYLQGIRQRDGRGFRVQDGGAETFNLLGVHIAMGRVKGP